MEWSCCTVTAKKIAEKFRGKVLGYYFCDNPDATLGRADCDGHDFAVVGQWLVDWWGSRSFQSPPILHLVHDVRRIARFYGKKKLWSIVVDKS